MNKFSLEGTTQSPAIEADITLRQDCILLPATTTRGFGSASWGEGGIYLSDGKPDPLLAVQMRTPCSDLASGLQTATRYAAEALFCGRMQGHFGHFICESTGCLWALDKFPKETPLVFIVRSDAKRELSRTARQWFALMKIKNPIIFINGPVIFERIWVPASLYNPIAGQNMQESLRNWIFSRLPGPDERGGGIRAWLQSGPLRRRGGHYPDLYVTRSGLPNDRGRVLGERAIEAGFRSEGYEIFRPEEYSLAEQIARYRTAKRIVLSESSSLHLMSIFCAQDVRLAMILRRAKPPATINIARETLLSQDVRFLAAVTKYWDYFDGEGIKGPMAVSELDFAKLWVLLEDNRFIRTAADMPIPDASEIRSERLRVAADRTILVDAKSAQKLDAFIE